MDRWLKWRAGCPEGYLLTALRFHGLTTQAPFEVWRAIENKAIAPRLEHPRPSKREMIGNRSAVSSIVDAGTELTKPAALLKNPQYLSGVERLRYHNHGSPPPVFQCQPLSVGIFFFSLVPSHAGLWHIMRALRGRPKHPIFDRFLPGSTLFCSLLSMKCTKPCRFSPRTFPYNSYCYARVE